MIDPIATVIVYHAVGDRPRELDPDGLFIAQDQFEAQMAFLARERTVVPLSQVLAPGTEGRRRRVAITFDDGFRNVLTDAVPVLRRHALPAALFVPTKWLRTPPAGSASLAHAHVLLASGGFALLGLAGLCGALFLAEHRRLKRRQALPDSGLPSLESLDRAGAVALAIGFPLLTLGVVTGAMWVHAAHGAAMTGNAHEIGALLAWCVYLVLVLQRFAVHQGARRCAVSALAGFALLSVWVVGVEMLA